MTAQDYKDAGYRLSLQVAQKDIDRAETDVTAAYIKKVAPAAVSTDADVKAAVMQLAFILLLQRSEVATRAGGKVKSDPNLSTAGNPSQGDMENADRLLRKVQTLPGLPSKLVDDIANIYYRTKYIGL